MKQKIKQKFKIELLIILAIVILYNLLFDTVIMTREQALEISEKYDEYVLFSAREFSWYLEKFQLVLPQTPLIGMTGRDGRNVVFFRWKLYSLKKKLKNEVRQELEGFKKDGYITKYVFDDKTLDVDIYLDDLQEKKFANNYGYSDYLLGQWKEEKWEKLATLCEKQNGDVHFETHDILSQEEKIVKKPKGDLYNVEEVRCLNKLLSGCTPDFDFSDETKVRGDSEGGRGGNICYLDLSDYSMVTGELDLSSFTKLKRVVLRGMNIEAVILPRALEVVESESFDNCDKLREITIPKSVKRFVNPVFYGCKNLQQINFEGDAPEVSTQRGEVFKEISKEIVIYRKKNTKGWEKKCWNKYDIRVFD